MSISVKRLRHQECFDVDIGLLDVTGMVRNSSPLFIRLVVPYFVTALGDETRNIRRGCQILSVFYFGANGNNFFRKADAPWSLGPNDRLTQNRNSIGAIPRYVNLTCIPLFSSRKVYRRFMGFEGVRGQRGNPAGPVGR